MKRYSAPVLAVSMVSFLISTVTAQDAVPVEILGRTLLVKAGKTTGTAFEIDHKGALYLVTAKHVVDGLKGKNAALQVWRKNGWEEVRTVKTLFPASDDVDIAVLETGEKVSQPFQIAISSTDEGVTMGQQVWFLGYPFGDPTLTSRVGDRMLPFIKKGTISAINASDPDAVVLYIDGFNNPGFSGGPIVYWQFSKRAYRIPGVVQGYRNDTAKLVVKGKTVDTNLLVNSGILTAYSIKHAVDAIEAED